MRDYHIHTTIRDGVHSIDEIAEFAIMKGFEEIGFSEHFGILPDDFENYMANIDMIETELEEIKIKRCSPFSMRGSLLRYFNFIDRSREKYGDRITLKKGVETDLYRSNAEKTYNFVKSLNPDYIIGAIHAFDQIGFHNYPTYFSVTEEDYKKYLREMIYFVKEKKMDILGHFYIYKCFVTFEDESVFYPLYEELAAACRDTGVVPEVNTGCMNMNFVFDPQEFFLKKCGEYDVPVIINSDAHNMYYLGSKFDIAFGLLQRAGVKYTASFTEGKKEIKEIDYKKAGGFRWFPEMNVVW